MFKRRRPDDPHGNRDRDMTPPTLAPPPGSTPPDDKPAPLAPAPAGGPAKPPEIVGVPPFRSAPPKEAPAMARTPFSSSPPSPATPTSIPPQPQSGQSPFSPRLQEPRSQVPRASTSTDRRTLVVGRGISVQGTVQDAERLVVEGTVEATMIQANELSISHGGVFKGEVQVDEAEVAGTIDGTLTARNSLVVRGSGRVLGTARCKRLQVEDGGQITGRIEMITDGTLAPKIDPPRVTAETAG